jgi:hypothetical protein
MVGKAIVASVEHVEQVILLIRGQKVLLATDLAALYGVTTKRLNQQVKRNIERFPEDFMFQLTADEKDEVVANCNHLSNLKYSPTLPYAFTEHGALMAASILNSERAIETSIFVVRAFVRLRQMLASHKDLERKLEALEERYEERFQVVFETLDQLLTVQNKPKKKIGFEVKEKKAAYGRK